MKILASDYDGTLRYGERVAKEDLDAIRRWQNAGHLFIIVTGRSMESFTNEMKKNKLCCDYIVANNGGVIYDGSGGRLQVSYMDYQRALELIDYISTLPCASYVINDGYYRHRIIVNEAENDLKYGDIAPIKDAQEILDSGKLAQIVVSLNNDQLAHEIVRYVNEQFSGSFIAYANRNCVDIVPSGISKADGLSYVLAYEGAEDAAVYTIGDSYNDLPMIEAFDGFCVANAPADIQEQVKKVYLNVGECIGDLMKE